MTEKTVQFGLVGCGLMGREFAGAAARWGQLAGDIARPVLAAVCSPRAESRAWFRKRVPTVTADFADYRELLAHPGLEAVYIAVPHHLHETAYVAAIEAGKDLLGEKPFGVDLAANQAILGALRRNPGVFARCASEFPFFPAMQQAWRWMREGRLGTVLGVRAGFRHAGDLDLEKPVSWKRQVATNGRYGCLGDLGIHTHHVPLRMGWTPSEVYASFQKFVDRRPDGRGGTAVCDTWDNALLLCDVPCRAGTFPMTLETSRMSPGDTNTWYFEANGLEGSVRFSTARPGIFSYTLPWGREQAWADVQLGHKPLFPTVTGGIFEFGFTDAILQMWAAFMAEREGRDVAFGCVTPAETALSHRLCTAALKSAETRRAEKV